MIKEKRLAKKYTQEKMASILGISLRQYVRIDNEEDLPRRDVLKSLIRELELTDEELGKYVREMTEEQVDQAIALLESLVAYYKTEVK